MLNMLFMEAYPEDADAEKASGLKLLQDGDAAFFIATDGKDLNKDDFLLHLIDVIDGSHLIAPNVLYRRCSETTHSLDKISGGVKVLWLMNHYNDKYIFPTSFIGENCYQTALDIGARKDVYMYDTSDIFFSGIEGHPLQECHGKLFDFYRKEIVDLDAEGFDCIDWFDERY